MESDECRELQPFLNCDHDVGLDDCESLQEDDVSSLDLRFPMTDVPAQETTYYCKIFRVWIPLKKTTHEVS